MVPKLQPRAVRRAGERAASHGAARGRPDQGRSAAAATRAGGRAAGVAAGAPPSHHRSRHSGCTAVFGSTRVPAHAIAEQFAVGKTAEGGRAADPLVITEMVFLAPHLAAAYPPSFPPARNRGWTRRRYGGRDTSWPPSRQNDVSDRCAPRRRSRSPKPFIPIGLT